MKATAPRPNYLAAMFALCIFAGQAWGQAPGRMLQVVVVEGEGVINNVRSRANREPVVRVEDENHKPVVGAAVVFFLPMQGPGGTYPNGTSSVTTTTDARGRAAARGAQFNQQAGPMQIRVAASYAGQTASAVINQSNVVGPVVTGGSSSSGGGLSGSAKIWILVGVAAAGAAGAIVATRGGSSSSSAPPPPATVTISPGTITVGAPPQ
jgi:hypothetical protein